MTDPTLTAIAAAMRFLGFTTAASNLALNWPSYSTAQRQRIADKWGVKV